MEEGTRRHTIPLTSSPRTTVHRVVIALSSRTIWDERKVSFKECRFGRPVMLGETFYYQRQNQRVNIYDACISVPDASLPYSRIFHLNDRSLVWPVSIDGNILMQTVDLSNIGVDQSICSFYCASWATGCYAYVACKPANPEEGTKFHLHVYELSASGEVNYLQDLKIGYKALDMSELTLDGGKYIFVVGGDRDIHVYEVENHSGKLFRSSNAESVKAVWKPMLGIGDSFCLRLLTENWGEGQQCISGFADGYMYWHARLGSKAKSERTISSDDSKEESVAKPELFWAAVLLDNAVTCVALYGKTRSFECRRRSFFQRIGMPTRTSRGDVVVAGLANGSLLMLSSSPGTNECTVLTGLEESTHGAIVALTTGDVTGNSIDDIVVGYYDGTVIVYAVHDEFFASTEHDPAATFSDEAFSLDISAGDKSAYENENMALVELFRLHLPFPVVGLAFGSFLSELETDTSVNESSGVQGSRRPRTVSFASNDSDSDQGEDACISSSSASAQVFFGEQLAVLTSRDFRLFVNRPNLKSKQQWVEERNKTNLMNDLVSELKAVE